MLTNIFLASLSVALLSLIGVFIFGERGRFIGTNRYVIPLAIGAFLGVVFFELIPETLEMAGEVGSIAIAAGFLSFYLLSHLLQTFHHHHDVGHEDGCEDKAGASMLLLGDAVHNFADGIVIASAFLLNPAVGVATTVGIALHEIPQEIAEFGVLLKAGYKKSKAALLNLLSASAVVVGALLTWFFIDYLGEYIWILTGLAAGNLLYIAASDLLPDVHEESRRGKHILGSFVATLIGLLLIMTLLGWAHEEFEGHDEPNYTTDIHLSEQ